MSKEDFIHHMRELIYRLNSPKGRDLFNKALTLYEDNLPSLEDQDRLQRAEALRLLGLFEARILESSVKIPHAVEGVVEPKKSVDAVIEEIAKNNNGVVYRKDGL